MVTPEHAEPGQPESEDSNLAHEQAWNAQYDLCRKVDERTDKLTAGKSDAYKAALTAYLIEHLAERLRMYLRLPESDEKGADV